MPYYDFYCTECGKIKEEVKISMTNFDEERKKVICCKKPMDRYFGNGKTTGIRTISSPSRF